ncbi:helicase associated domain-containing protein [Paeniglutamicibacter antarcticus]|uniref:Helicase associated domain-containing protein n=1 Tax=Arthrobacter terrae TaxID=2935737 RepID=A0A931CHF2_9MICC|nr:helicase associated domain-containing protein [Arthrobacter terrae]MBG0738637.1 helicase associated domain-containing protein [Arthrobacter terrae]
MAPTVSSPASATWQERWARNLAAIIRFQAEKGRLPVQGAKETTERKLASWLSVQRMRAGPARANTLDKDLPGWRGESRTSQWETKMEAAAVFAAAHGHHPRSKSSNRAEKLLGYWLVHQRRTATPERVARLDERIPDWRESQHQAWTVTVDQIAVFVKQHGHIPHQTGQDASERHLANWLKGERMNPRPERVTALDNAAPGWRGNHPGLRSWEDSLTAVRKFLADNGRLPSGGADDVQRRLAVWVSDQSRRATDEQRSTLDRLIPGWQPTLVSWKDRHESVMAFHDTNGRFPDRTDTGEAKTLAMWLIYQRHAASSDARTLLDASIPGWHVTLDDKWDARLNELKTYVSGHGCLPHTRSSEVAEKSLGRWMEKQRRTTDPTRTERLDASVPGWRGRGATV